MLHVKFHISIEFRIVMYLYLRSFNKGGSYYGQQRRRRERA